MLRRCSYMFIKEVMNSKNDKFKKLKLLLK